MEMTEVSFKPYYNWNTFNTYANNTATTVNGRFKPYYNWNTFNTDNMLKDGPVWEF